MERKFKRSETTKPLSNLNQPTKKPNQPSLERSSITQKKKDSTTDNA